MSIYFFLHHRLRKLTNILIYEENSLNFKEFMSKSKKGFRILI